MKRKKLFKPADPLRPQIDAMKAKLSSRIPPPMSFTKAREIQKQISQEATR